MTKLEIISELLGEELHEFKNQAQRVEKVSHTLKDVKIKADSTEIKMLLQDFPNKQDQIQAKQKVLYKEIQVKLKKPRIIPNWLLDNPTHENKGVLK